MWIVAFVAYLTALITKNNMVGISVGLAFLIFMNPPVLWILKGIKNKRPAEFFSLFINLLEIIGYTSIIYSLGGVRALFVTPLYAILITYVGTLGPWSLPFIISTFCTIILGLMLGLEYFGFLPNLSPLQEPLMPGRYQMGIFLTVTCYLYILAFISAYIGNLLKKSKQRLRLQNIELEEALSKAQEADRMKSEFLANMSHELRTPLNHIIGFTELVADKQFGDLNEEQEEYLNDVLHSSYHLLSLIDDILDLAKIEAGKLELNAGEVNLRMLLETSLVMIKEKAFKRGIHLSKEFDSIPEIIKADERKLKQILYNLLSNAAKFTPEGGSIRLAAGQVSMVHGDLRGKEGVEISVSDSGIGLKKEDLERIFNPFEQVENAASRKYQGTGLGLSLTRSLVELHRGKIWAESEGEGRGSIFRFVIPV
jgi:signal transduction histidine kinase